VMKTKPMGIIRMTPAGWPDRLPQATRWAYERLPQGRLGGRTRKFTLLGNAVWGIGGAKAGGGLVRLIDGNSSQGRITQAATAATSLAQA